MRKSCDVEKWWKWKRRVKIAIHYRHAIQPPERRPTRTVTARAKVAEWRQNVAKLAFLSYYQIMCIKTQV